MVASTFAAVKRPFEIYGLDLNGDGCIYPRDVTQATGAQLTSYRSKTIYNQAYDAFPYAVKIGSSIIGIFSTGAAHAQSDKQVMFRTNDNGLTFQTVDFFINSTGVFNTSLLTDLLGVGEAVVLKVWTVKNTAGVLGVTTTSIVSGYAVWSKPKLIGSVLLRTGYNSTTWETALLQSTDAGVTWTVKSVIAPSTSGLLYNEADIVQTVPSNLVAYIREDSGAGDNLYQSISTNDGVTWSTPTVVSTTVLQGRQPNLIKLADGSIILATGDRSGISGYTGSGEVVGNTSTTGISVFKSTDNGTTWTYRTRIAPMYSTDGGQPFLIEIGSGVVFAVWYARKTIKGKPSIVSCTFDSSYI